MPLYKYFQPDRIDILENSLIRFTQPSTFNDPFECFPYIKIKEVADKHMIDYLNKFQCGEEEKEKKLLNLWEEEQEKHPELNVPYQLFRNFMNLKVNMIKPLIRDLVQGRASSLRSDAVCVLLLTLSREIGILCLTEKMDNLLMWAHYSSNHTGFVIEFNETHSFFLKGPEMTGDGLKKVHYSITRPEITLLDPARGEMENLLKWLNDIFCVKSERWQYEQEWRMIVPLRRCQNVISSEQTNVYLFKIPKSCITGIILGCRMSNSDKERILNVLRNDDDYRHLSLRQAEMDEKEFKLRFIEISR